MKVVCRDWQLGDRLGIMRSPRDSGIVQMLAGALGRDALAFSRRAAGTPRWRDG